MTRSAIRSICVAALRCRYAIGCGVAALLCLAAWTLADDSPPRLPPAAKRQVEFAADIQPIFAKSCAKCHGADKQQAGLRLDRKADAFRGGDSGRVIEPGKSAESTLIHYVAGTDPDLLMPPKGQGERLTAEQIGLLRAWIDQGAKWSEATDAAATRVKSDHWSFQPVVRPSVPSVKNAVWVRNPVDNFVLAKLESLGIAPAPEADRATLIRRLSLDLRGLPPSTSEVDEFLSDTRSDAWQQLIDRFLASPHFGERWGRHWLDLARYADSDGYEKDTARPFAYKYRNWVIDAINNDLPFDQFTIEQLAGDLLPEATLEQKIATGFHRNTLTNKEGGVDQEEFRVAANVNRVSTTGAAWLGLTIGCAQCHTHKYDPITQREFYQFYAFFNSTNEVNIPAPSAAEVAAYEQKRPAYDAEHAKLVAALQDYEKHELPARQLAWEQTISPNDVSWTILEPASIESAGGAKFRKLVDGSYLATGKNPAADTYTIRVETPLHGITAFRLEVLDDPSLPAKGPGRVAHGNFVLSEFQVTAAPLGPSGPSNPAAIALQNPTADFAQGDSSSNNKASYMVAYAIDGKRETGWAIGPRFGQRHVAVFETKDDIGSEAGTVLTFTLEQQYGQQHTIGRLRLSATTAPRPVQADGLPDELPIILAIAPEKRTAKQKATLSAYFKTVDPEYVKLAAAVAAHEKQAPVLTSTQAQTIAATDKPRDTHVLIRGDFLRPGDDVSPGTLAVLNELKPATDRPTRVDLARWIVDPANPLTGRVTMNYWWQHLFGRGLVPTVEDFGIRGEPPTHPELLDWLASELIARHWSRKEMIRLIANSATYRQSSHTPAELLEKDPRNNWLARQNRYRLEAEVVRDLYLAASGLLIPKVGGPSVRPPLPAGVAELGYAGSIKWPESKGDDKYRRGLYIFFQRTVPYPMLTTFDAPDSNNACMRRERSNTPLQALTLLNDPVFVECAQSLGRRSVRESSESSTERIRHMFRLCLARDPRADELSRLAALYGDLLILARADQKGASDLAGGSREEASRGEAVFETAAAVALARVILNLDEFVVRE